MNSLATPAVLCENRPQYLAYQDTNLDIVEMVSSLSRVGIQSLKSTRKGIGHLQIIPECTIWLRGLKDFI